MDRQRLKWMISMAGLRFYLLRVAFVKFVRLATLRTVQLAFAVCMGFAGVWLLEGFQIIKYDDGPKLRPDKELNWHARPAREPLRPAARDDSTDYAVPEEREGEEDPEARTVRREDLPSDARPVNSVRYVRGSARAWTPRLSSSRRFVRAQNFIPFSTGYEGGARTGFDASARQGALRRFDDIPMGHEQGGSGQGGEEHTLAWAERVLAEAERRGYDPKALGIEGERSARVAVGGVDPRRGVPVQGGSGKGRDLVSSPALVEEARAIVSRAEAEREARIRYWRAMGHRLLLGLGISLVFFLLAAVVSGLLKGILRLTYFREPTEEEDLERRTRKLRLMACLGLLGLAAPARAASGSKPPLQPDACWTLGAEDCARQPACRPDPWMCDYVPEGKTFEQVCPHGGKGACSPKEPWALCCPLDAKACAGYEACRSEPWRCLPGKDEECVYGPKGACMPRRAPNMVREPSCDLRKAKPAAAPPSKPSKPEKPVYQLMGFKTEREYELYLLDLRRKNKLIGEKEYERELEKLKGLKTGP